ncbi:MAG TPA: hypothetical protein PLY16_00475, partial [Candidatus Saccharibacteria bacterium]|nr:hypothetical protein [Candidatus Saccharibacteria bacterium]
MDKDNPQNTPTPNPDEELKNAIETSFAPQEEVSETPEITPADEAPAEAPAPEMPVEAEPAPAPTPAPEPITPEPETLSPVGDNIAYPAKKPRSKSTLILLSILAVVIIGAGTTLAIWLSQGGSIGNLIPNTQNNQDTNEQTETPLTA